MAGAQRSGVSRRARLKEFLGREDDFGVVLLLILLTIISFAAAVGPIGQFVSVALSGGTLLFVLHTAQAGRRAYRISAVIVSLAVLSTGLAMLIGDEMGRTIAGVVGLLLAVLAPIVILRRIITSPTITVRLVLGALAIYLLLGLAYAYLFPVIAILSGSTFFVQTSTAGTLDYVYFSYTTLATVGYGDFTAATSLGRMVAISEGLVGQLFLVSAVALLVGNVGRSIRPMATPAADTPATPAVDAQATPATAEEVTPPGR
ncbi:MAG TPA: potassium channel family protein [Candidatus Deferrimicrobium sp.]|nr:potassium channel family protein [Candidatus Deferrimicrobium sp.]